MTDGGELASAFAGARRRGDWNPLLKLLRPSMLRWVERKFPAGLRKRLDPEDVVQAAQWSIYLGLREFQETDPRALRAWTYTVTLRTLRDHVRYHERQRRDVHSDETLVAEPRAPTKQEADRPRSWRAESVHEALARLPEAERRVVTLRHVEGRPWHEVTRAVGRTLWDCRDLDVHALARLSRWLRS
jgi:RNA polymerase sigma factor (sigma-70 family)